MFILQNLNLFQKMITKNNREIGNRGEDIAVEFLQKKEYKILHRNYQKRQGELDIVAKDKNGTLVFVEVKAKASSIVAEPFNI